MCLATRLALENLSIRRECTDHMIVLGENHVRRILANYQIYYNDARTHLSLERNSPVPRRVEPVSKGRVVAIPQVGGSIICTPAPPESGLLESQPPLVWGLLCLQPLAIGPVRSSLAFSCSRDA